MIGVRGHRVRTAVRRAGAAAFWRLFAAPPEQQLWGLMVPRQRRPRRAVAVLIVAPGQAVVTQN